MGRSISETDRPQGQGERPAHQISLIDRAGRPVRETGAPGPSSM